MDYMTLKEAASLLTVQPMLFRIFTGFLSAFLTVRRQRGTYLLRLTIRD